MERSIAGWCRGLGLVTIVIAAGCVNPSSFFNDDFLVGLGAVPSAEALPGEAPAVVIGVENQTQRFAEFLITWRNVDGDLFQQATRIIPPGDDFLFSVFCPVESLTLGDVSDLTATGAVIRLGDGTSNDALIEVEPFGILLQEGINYACGDRIVFAVRPSNATLSGFQTFAIIERSGVQQAFTGTGGDASGASAAP